MEKTDLDRLTKPCPTCGGSETVFDGWQFVTCPDCTNGLVPAESAEEYAARLQGLAEQARKERDWLAQKIACAGCVGHDLVDVCTPDACLFEHNHLPAKVTRWLTEAARAVAGKDGASEKGL